jgi:hypothetical protein
MHAIKIDKTSTCEAHCTHGDFDMAAGPYPEPTQAAVLNQAAMHSMETGHTVDEVVRSDMHVHRIHEENTMGDG